LRKKYMTLLATALQDYESPDGLVFRKGDVIQILANLPSGWYEGTINNQKHYFPKEYVTNPENFDRNMEVIDPELKVDAKLAQKLAKCPPDWGVKRSTDGRYFYYNYKTFETKWNVKDSTLPIFVVVDFEEYFGKLQHSSENATSWTAYSRNITIKLKELAVVIRERSKNKLIRYSSAVIGLVKEMLKLYSVYESDAPTFNLYPNLKLMHTFLVESLYDIAVAAKSASVMWPVPDCYEKLMLSTQKVHRSVQDFVLLASELKLKTPEVVQYNPLIIDASISDPNLSREIQSVVSNLERICETVVTLISHVPSSSKERLESAEILAKVKMVVSETESFLSIVDDIPFDSKNNQLCMNFKSDRLELFNCLSNLVPTTSGFVKQLRLYVNISELVYPKPENGASAIGLAAFVKCLRDLETSCRALLATSILLLKEQEIAELGLLMGAINKHNNSVQKEFNETQPKNDYFVQRLNKRVSSLSWSSKLSDQSRLQSASTRHSMSDENSRPSVDSSRLSYQSDPRRMSTCSNHEDYTHADVLYYSNGLVKGGTLQGFVERITTHMDSDMPFTHQFLLTYRAFASSIELWSELRNRLLLSIPEDLDPETLSIFLNETYRPVVLK
jgi:hypothetical protein